MGMTLLTSSETLRASAPTQAQVEAEHLDKMWKAEEATLYVVKRLEDVPDDLKLEWFQEILCAFGLDKLNRMHHKFERQLEREARMAMRIKARKKLPKETQEQLGQPICGYARA